MKKTSFLEYYKIILQKVSFDDSIFRNEYRKAALALRPHEFKELRKWLRKSSPIVSR